MADMLTLGFINVRYLEQLAQAGDWITFLFESQRGGYPPDIPLQVARTQFADPAVGAHLVLVLAQLAKTNPRGSTEVRWPALYALTHAELTHTGVTRMVSGIWCCSPRKRALERRHACWLVR
jgi:hypothetical protein